MSTFTIKIGGEAGQGLVSVGNILLQAIAKEGWYLFSNQDYESRIRGGHNFYQIRLAPVPCHAMERKVDCLVAFDRETLRLHEGELKENGVVIVDSSLVEEEPPKENYVPIPFRVLAKEVGKSPLMANAAAAGAIWAFLKEDTSTLKDVLAGMFEKKGMDVVARNQETAQRGFEEVLKLRRGILRPLGPENKTPKLLLKGNEALPLGAIAAGVQFMGAYPMTPATGVTEFIAKHAQDLGIVMEQAEDEIAAVNMCIGASYAGARTLTATSGGGFALMTEALGLAGSAEIPLVVINAMRPGPSTGLPTRTEQGDLRYALGASSGDFPKAIFSPGDVTEAFYLMAHAFNLAEAYQMPVMVLSDQYLADSHETVEPFCLSSFSIDYGAQIKESEKDYKRYEETESGVSPRLLPGGSEGLVVCAGDEHDCEGHLIEDASLRRVMMEKRMRKLKGVKAEVLPPVVWGDEDYTLCLISFGSTKGVLKETTKLLQERGVKVKGVHLPQVYPLPPQIEEYFLSGAEVFVVEGNFSGQLEALLRQELLKAPTGSVRRFDGRPLDPDYILEHLKGGAFA